MGNWGFLSFFPSFLARGLTSSSRIRRAELTSEEATFPLLLGDDMGQKRRAESDIENVGRYRTGLGCVRVDLYDSSSEDQDDSSWRDLLEDLITDFTVDIHLYRTDLHGKKLEAMVRLDDHALFLGYNASLCLPIKDFPGLMKPNHAYIMDDSLEFVNYFKHNRKRTWHVEHQKQILERLGGASPLEDPWLNWPAPI
uniref:KIB1-4 beta-propeller domain-containing protein n=1 Tax=Oryza punctata TaxID=4537 RepID=A0A0E0MGU2_ORYPU